MAECKIAEDLTPRARGLVQRILTHVDVSITGRNVVHVDLPEGEIIKLASDLLEIYYMGYDDRILDEKKVDI